MAQQKFRKLFLTLIGNEKKREHYIKEELEDEFGLEFFEQLQKLTQNFIDVVDAASPPPMIDRVRNEISF